MYGCIWSMRPFFQAAIAARPDMSSSALVLYDRFLDEAVRVGTS